MIEAQPVTTEEETLLLLTRKGKDFILQTGNNIPQTYPFLLGAAREVGALGRAIKAGKEVKSISSNMTSDQDELLLRVTRKGDNYLIYKSTDEPEIISNINQVEARLRQIAKTFKNRFVTETQGMVTEHDRCDEHGPVLDPNQTDYSR